MKTMGHDEQASNDEQAAQALAEMTENLCRATEAWQAFSLNEDKFVQAMRDFNQAALAAAELLGDAAGLLAGTVPRLTAPTRWQRFSWRFRDFWLERRWG